MDDFFETIVGRSDAQWEPGEQKDGTISRHYIKRVDAKPEIRVWAFLFSDSILPSFNKSQLRKEMCTLLYCIHNNLAVDLARLISWKIHETANIKPENCLGYPLLITKLVHSQMRNRAPGIDIRIKPQKELAWVDVKRMLAEQEKALEEPRVE